MATTVASIISQSNAIAATRLGATWNPLAHVFDLDRNDERRVGKVGAYGTRPLEGSNAATLTNAYALNHGFELILMRSLARGTSDDTEAMTAATALYSEADEIFKRMVRSKLNLSGTVLDVIEPGVSAPEFYAGRKHIAVRLRFTVKYRQQF